MKSQSVLVHQRPLWNVRDFSTTFAQLSNFAYILLLITIYRQANDEPHPHIPVSKLPVIVTWVAVVVFGLWVVFALIRLAFTPYTYSQLRDYALRIGQTPPSLQALVRDAIRAFLLGCCMLAAPYIVWQTVRRQRAVLPYTEVGEEAPGNAETETEA